MEGATALTVLDNFFGTELKTDEAVKQAFYKLSAEQVQNLVQEFRTFDANWITREPLGPETMNLGRAYDTFRNPLSWVPKYSEVDKHLDAKFVSRLLLYYPRISVWTPEMKEVPRILVDSADSRETSDVCAFAKRLVAIRPLLSDGSVQIIPDSLYARLSGWPEEPSSFQSLQSAVLSSPDLPGELKDRVKNCATEEEIYSVALQHFGPNWNWIDDLDFPKPPPAGAILRAARRDSSLKDLRAILDKIDFIPEDANFCSDHRYIWGLENAEQIRYINPLNEINEDVLVQRELGCSALCANEVMLQLMNVKYSGECATKRDMVWQNVSIALPALGDISQEDLIKVRQSEDCFQIWRDTLSKAIRVTEQQLAVGELSVEDVRDIFREEAQPAAVALEAKIKKTPLSSVARSAGVSFISGAAAGLLLNPEPLTAVATGAITSVIKGSYDAMEARKSRKEEPLVRIFSALIKKA